MRPARPLAVLTLAVLLGACQMGGGGPPGGPGGPGPQAPPDDRVLIEAATAGPGDVASHLVATGVLESERQADLVPEASGVVTQILVEEGDVVSQGQLLAVLSNPSLDGAARRADLTLESARQDAARAETLHAQGALSEAEYTAAKAALSSAEASYQEATRTRGFTRLTAPFAGVVALRDLHLGELAGGKRAFQVVDLDTLRVVVQLPEKDLPRVAPGQPATLQGAYDAQATAQGQVARVAPVIDPNSGTARVTVSVTPGQRALRPGQFVTVRLQVDEHRGVLTIPRDALVWEDGEPVAFRVEDAPKDEKKPEDSDKPAEEPGWFAGLFGGEKAAEAEEVKPPDYPRRVAKKVRLKVGYADLDRVEILDGLEAGAPVVTLGTDGLRDGTAVRLPSDPPPKKPEKDDQKDASEGSGA